MTDYTVGVIIGGMLFLFYYLLYFLPRRQLWGTDSQGIWMFLIDLGEGRTVEIFGKVGRAYGFLDPSHFAALEQSGISCEKIKQWLQQKETYHRCLRRDCRKWKDYGSQKDRCPGGTEHPESEIFTFEPCLYVVSAQQNASTQGFQGKHIFLMMRPLKDPKYSKPIRTRTTAGADAETIYFTEAQGAVFSIPRSPIHAWFIRPINRETKQVDYTLDELKTLGATIPELLKIGPAATNLDRVRFAQQQVANAKESEKNALTDGAKGWTVASKATALNLRPPMSQTFGSGQEPHVASPFWKVIMFSIAGFGIGWLGFPNGYAGYPQFYVELGLAIALGFIGYQLVKANKI